MRAFRLARSFCDRRTELMLLLALMVGLAGCSSKSSPVKLSPGTTLEVFAIVAAKDASTTEAIDPATGGPIFLQTPPIITTTDVASVARSAIEYGTASGQVAEQPALAVELTPGGSAKMSAATANAGGEPVAVVINGHVIATPKILSPIQSSFQISGDSSVTAAIEALTKL
jgi:preprotein translocase subunit SecD